MGAPMAVNLQKGGHQLFVHSHKAPSAELTDLGAIPCASSQEVARQADIIILMLPDTPQVQEVLFDENGVASGLRGGQIVVDMSSISPVATNEFAKKLNEIDCLHLDAPVSGGQGGAKERQLSIERGGTAKTFETV